MTYYRRPWGLYLLAVATYCFLFAPIVLVVANSFNGDSTMINWGGFTTHWYHAAWSNPAVTTSARNSIEIALLTTLASAVLGTAAAIALYRSRGWIRNIITGLTYARIVIPELVLALALVVIFDRLHARTGIWTTVAGHTVFDSAYVTIIVAARLASRDASVDEAAQDLYATPIRVFARVTLPDIWPGIVAGSLLAFTFSLDDVVSSFFLAGSTNTLPLVILSLVRINVTPVVNAIGAVLMTATLSTMGLLLLLSRRWTRAGQRPPAAAKM